MKDSPARRLSIGHASAAKPLEVIAGARRHRLLVVDDEQAVRSVLRRYLDRRGWEVLEAESGEQALALIDDAATRIDAVIVDVHMPGLAGTALCQRIAAARPALLSRMIVATGDAPAATAALAREQLICPVLPKPFELSELEQALAKLLRS
jgi:two-component system cell cycle sensor histidine kinase/response regulator CckA